ncbi:MAG: alanine racemase [Parasphingorhabdus sp.]
MTEPINPQNLADFADLQTPALLLDLSIVDANTARLRQHLARVAPDILHRPHLKTAKSTDIAEHVLAGQRRAITVSTLREAEEFAAIGINDILFAVGIVPSKLERVLALREAGIDLKIIVDNVAMAKEIARFSREKSSPIPTLIEIDCDGHRSGVKSSDAAMIAAIAASLEDGAEMAGVMTHAGGSYDASSAAQIARAATSEVTEITRSARILRDAGFEVPIVSLGSTPTALSVQDLSGVTEVRAGVYMFFDLVMSGLRVCPVEAIALSVLTTVIGHQPDKGWIIVDAGWMAMSRDRGTASQELDQGYGLVCDQSGKPCDDLIMISANQEHGIITARPGSTASLPDIAVGDQLRILPNHACSTAAQHDRYHVLDTDNGVKAIWPRFNGW